MCNILVRGTEQQQYTTHFDGVVIATERVVVRELRFVVRRSAREQIVTQKRHFTLAVADDDTVVGYVNATL